MIGRRYTLMGALAVSFIAVTLEFVATSNEMFFGGKFLNGFVVGTIQTVAGSYIGEVSVTFTPTDVVDSDRGYRSSH